MILDLASAIENWYDLNKVNRIEFDYVINPMRELITYLDEF